MKKLLALLLIIIMCTPMVYAAADVPETDTYSQSSVVMEDSSDGSTVELIDVYLNLNNCGSIKFSNGSVARDGVYYLGAFPAGSTISQWLESEGRSSDVASLCSPSPSVGSTFTRWRTTAGETWSITDSQVRPDDIDYEPDETKSMTLFADWKSAFLRIAGNTRCDTSMAIADTILKEKRSDFFDAVIIASADNYPDALSGSSLAAVTGAPVLLTNNAYNSTVSYYVHRHLKSGGTVYILGGSGAVSESIETNFLGFFDVQRLAGANRIETNLKILNKVKELSESKSSDEDSEETPCQDVILCTAYGYADSLSASATGKAIMLVGPSLTAEQKAYLKGLSEANIYAIGGPAVVGKEVLAEVNDCTGTSARRIYGKSRYETSALIAKEFFQDSDNLVVAYGNNYPDGLSGSSLALTRSCPLLLAADNCTEPGRMYVNKAGVTSMEVLGGRALISDKAAYDLLNGYIPESYSKVTTELLDNLNLDNVRNLMIVAHPDDETLWGGCHLAEEDYLVVCLTNGDNIVRNNEIVSATTLSGDKAIILTYPDMESGRKDNWKKYKTDITADINTLITYKNWNTIVTHNPDGEYGHMHHKMTSSLVADACDKAGCYNKLHYFEVYYEKGTMPLSYKPNMSTESQAMLDNMLGCYKSQHVEIHNQMKGYEAFIKASRWGYREQLTAKAYN